MKTCIAIGCDRPARAKGYCTKHYQRFKANGDPSVVKTTAKTGPLPKCSATGCSQDARNYTSPFCEKHYSRNRRHGDSAIALKDHTPANERWKTSYEIDSLTECWNWTGPFSRGYGFIQDGAKKRYVAHRYVWEQIVGPIKKGHVLDRHNPDFGCMNKKCVNPTHLEEVPQAINALRGGADGGNAAKTECDHGHEFTPENTYVRSNGWRCCRACNRRRMREGGYRKAYVYLWRPKHPIADRAGKVQEHRMVLYDDIGSGPHPCHWCNTPTNWGGVTGLNVDHLDGDPSNNLRENLVPSCQSCNKSRAASGNLADWKPKASVTIA